MPFFKNNFGQNEDYEYSSSHGDELGNDAKRTWKRGQQGIEFNNYFTFPLFLHIYIYIYH